MSRRGWGFVLLGFAVFMVVGFANSSVSLSDPAGLAAVLLTIVLPAGAGIHLVRSPGGRRNDARRDELRRQTLQAEVLRLAGAHEGKLTVVEVVTGLGVTHDAAKEALNALMLQDVADVEVTPGGVLVYSFRDVQRLGEKSESRKILE